MGQNRVQRSRVTDKHIYRHAGETHKQRVIKITDRLRNDRSLLIRYARNTILATVDETMNKMWLKIINKYTKVERVRKKRKVGSRQKIRNKKTHWADLEFETLQEKYNL